jgi:hypothetical protein
LARAAKSVPADLYIAHNLAALPAAALAAKVNAAKLGFDAEDFHLEELASMQRNTGDQFARSIIEGELLPRCVHQTAAAPMIAEAYGQRYGTCMQPILNVSCLSEAPSQSISAASCIPHSLYWFSQTIGPGRGLEELLVATRHMRKKPTLYLRGNPAAGYAERLKLLAADCGTAIELLPASAPRDMIQLAAPYAVGLAIEPGSSPNNALALSNKIFTYLMAGIPILLSRTSAQEMLARELGESALLVNLHDPMAVADQLETFLADIQRQTRARNYAWELARHNFNWELQKQKFLAIIERELAAPSITRC